MIQEHIHKLLFEHDCVIIPDFGGLITHYEPARIHPIRHAILPPTKRVAFNEKLKLNDGLLISTFAYEKKISAEEAHQQVGSFVRQLQEELHQRQRFELRGIGLFRLNTEQKIEFEYLSSSNFLDDSFGLPELITRPILAEDAMAGLRTLLKEQKNDQAVSAGKPSLRRRIRKVYDTAAILAIAGLSCSALYFISLQTDYDLSSLNPFALFGQSAKVAQAASGQELVAVHRGGVSDSPLLQMPESEQMQTASVDVPLETAPTAVREKVVTAAPAAKEKKEAIAVAPSGAVSKKEAPITINAITNRYYIIAGGYSSLKSARWGLRHVSRLQGEGKVILPVKPGALHRVSVQDFASREEALQHLPELKQKYGNNIWILNY